MVLLVVRVRGLLLLLASVSHESESLFRRESPTWSCPAPGAEERCGPVGAPLPGLPSRGAPPLVLFSPRNACADPSSDPPGGHPFLGNQMFPARRKDQRAATTSPRGGPGSPGPPRTHPGQCPHTARTSPVPVRAGTVRSRPSPVPPCCLGRWGGAAPPPCSRPHPLKEQEGEVGNTTALLRKRKGSRRKGGTGIRRDPGTRPAPRRPGSEVPPRPPPDLPANDTPPHP